MALFRNTAATDEQTMKRKMIRFALAVALAAAAFALSSCHCHGGHGYYRGHGHYGGHGYYGGGYGSVCHW